MVTQKQVRMCAVKTVICPAFLQINSSRKIDITLRKICFLSLMPMCPDLTFDISMRDGFNYFAVPLKPLQKYFGPKMISPCFDRIQIQKLGVGELIRVCYPPSDHPLRTVIYLMFSFFLHMLHFQEQSSYLNFFVPHSYNHLISQLFGQITFLSFFPKF